MRVKYRNCWSEIDGTDEELSWLRDYTSVDSYRYDARAKRRVHKSISLLTPLQKLPSGLVPLMVRAGKEDGIDVLVEDLRIPPCDVDRDADIGWLRDYQVDAVRSIIKRERGIIKVATGGGKTEIFIGITRLLPCEWLFVVHRSTLVRQTMERYQLRTGEKAGYWDSSQGWVRGTGNTTVMTFQALWRAFCARHKGIVELTSHIGGLNVDEVHAQPADTFWKCTMALSNAYYRVGQSGTPLNRSDLHTLRTMGALGPIAYTIPTQLLVERGVLAHSNVRMVRCEQHAESSTWQEVHKTLILESDKRNSLLVDIATAATKPALLFVDRKVHGLELCKRLERTGLSVAFAYGNDGEDARASKIRRLVQGKHDVLVCSVIFQEGIDIPDLASVIVGTGRKSSVDALQRLGRGIRRSQDKSTFELWDIYDCGHTWLKNHADERLSAYESEGHVVQLGSGLW